MPIKMFSTAVAKQTSDCIYLIVHDEYDRKHLIIVKNLHENSHGITEIRDPYDIHRFVWHRVGRGFDPSSVKGTRLSKVCVCVCVCVCVFVCVCVCVGLYLAHSQLCLNSRCCVHYVLAVC